MDIQLRGRLLFKYDFVDINTIVRNYERDAVLPLTDEGTKKEVEADAVRKAYEFSPNLVLKRSIFALPRQAKFIFTQPDSEERS